MLAVKQNKGTRNRRKGSRQISLAVIAAILCGALTQGPFAAAGDPEDGAPPALALSPAVVMLKGKPGQSATQRLTLSNRTQQAFSFEMVALDVIVRDGKRVFVSAGEIPGSIAATAVFSQQHVVVPAGQSVSVTVTLTVPPETSVRAVVAMFRGTQKIPAGGNLSMSASLGTLLTFNLTDNFRVHPEPLVVGGQTPTSNVAFSQWLRNIGTEPGQVTGMAAVLNESGQLVGKTPFPVQRLLPGQRIEFRADYPAELPPGRYRVFASFEVEGKVITQSKEFVIS